MSLMIVRIQILVRVRVKFYLWAFSLGALLLSLLALEVFRSAFLSQIEVGISRFLPLLVYANSRNDECLILEGIETELLLAVMYLNFPDVRGDFFEEISRNDKTRIFLKELDPHGDRLSSRVVEVLKPVGNRLGAVSPPEEFD